MNMNPKTLKAIIDQAQDGDERALEQLYESFYDRIVGYAFRRVLDGEVAQDIAANVFMKVLQNLHKFTWRHDHSFEGWIFRIASNEVNNYFRRQQKYKFVASEDAEKILDNWTLDDNQRDTVERELDQNQQFMKLHKAIARLSEREQEILHMYYFEHLPHQAIAEALDMRDGAVRVAMHRAQKKLESSLKHDPEFAKHFIGGVS